MSPFSVIVLLFVVVSTVLGAPAGFDNVDSLEKRGSRNGKATWFNVGLGACGKKNKDSDKILALSGKIYSKGKYCDEKVKIKNTANGKTATGIVRDMCPGCGSNDIDLSPSLFKQLGNLDTGVLSVSWEFA